MAESTEMPQESTSTVTTEERFRFHGEGGEFFRIWIVNLVLSIVTLGIYSAWAKVRTKRYFYGNTELAGDRFDYLASPIAILKGRIIAVVLLVIYTVLSVFFVPASYLMLALLLLVMPFVVMRSIRFNAVMSSWRGVRFGFGGDLFGAYKAALLWPLFGLVTLGLGMPYAWYKQNQYLYNNYSYGRSTASTVATPRDFYVVLLVVLGIGFIGGLVLALLAAAVAEIAVFAIAIGLGYLAMYVLIYAGYQATYFSAVFNNVELQGNRLQTDVTVKGLFMVVMPNTVFTLLTLGLYYPWAAVRVARYMQDHLWVEAVDLDSFVAQEREHENALGDEIGEAFDFGIGI
ncbi:MAG: YjgN family protein [Pseudomonadales bacterium]